MPAPPPASRVVVALPRGASGGMRRVAEDLADGLAAAGWRVAGPGDGYGAPPRGRLRGWLLDLTDGVRAGRQARCGLLHLHTGGPRRMVPLLIGARLAGCHRVVVTLHGPGAQVRWPLRRRLAARLARSIVVPSESAARLHRANGFRSARLVVVPNGVVPLPPASRSEARRRFGIDQGAFVAGFVARLVPEKGLATLLVALRDVPGALLLVGGDGPARADLERTAAATLAGRCRFTGWLDREGVAHLLAAADVLVLPSERESAPLAIIEAAFAGCPVIATGIPAIREVTGGGQAALLVPPGDATGLAAALCRLRDDATLGAQLAATAHTLAVDEFTISRMVERYVAVFCV